MSETKPKYSILDHRIAGWYFPWMMKGLTPTSSPLEEKIRLMKRLGFDGVGTSWWELVAFYQERGDLGQLKRISTELDFPLTCCGFSADGWAFGGEKAQKNALLIAKSSLELIHAAGCDRPYITGPFDRGDVRSAAQAFREMAQYADSLGMSLALEFMGPASQVNTLTAARELVEQADVPGSGVALDSYHFYAGGSTPESLESFPLEKILVMHLADAAGDLRDPSLELDRSMPGEGELPLDDFVGTVQQKGFSGYWHVECIQGNDYAVNLRGVATRALTATRRVVERQN
jgi:sugar phosphate isomerase/epimerase